MHEKYVLSRFSKYFFQSVGCVRETFFDKFKIRLTVTCHKNIARYSMAIINIDGEPHSCQRYLKEDLIIQLFPTVCRF